MPNRKDPKPAAAPGVVNWNPPAKRDLVERAVSDGMTDPTKIAAWSKNYDVTMTAEEVRRLMTDLGK
jgi:hypothetical protein